MKGFMNEMDFLNEIKWQSNWHRNRSIKDVKREFKSWHEIPGELQLRGMQSQIHYPDTDNLSGNL